MTANLPSRHLITLFCFLAALTLAAAGCSSQPATAPITPAATVPPVSTRTPTATITPLPSPTATPTPIIEPALPPAQSSDPLAVDPPENFDNALKAQVNDGAFGLVCAHVVYTYYRSEVGPAMWSSDAEFIEAMDTYAASLEAQGIEVYQATAPSGTTYSMLVEGTSILLNFDPSGALTFADPGYWTADSEPIWIDAAGPVDLVIGPDHHAYIVRLNSEGNVVAYLNTLGATLDNIDDQWISVTAGRPDMVWNGSEFISAGIPILEIMSACTTNPDVINEGVFPSCEHYLELPSPITQEEFARWQQGELGLGVIARDNSSDGSLRGVVLVGEIVSIESRPITFADGRSGISNSFIIDVPHRQAGSQDGIIRFTFGISDYPTALRATNLDELLANAADLQAQGIDLTQVDYLSELMASVTTAPQLTFSDLVPDMVAHPDLWVGSRLGLYLNTQAVFADNNIPPEDLTVLLEYVESPIPTMFLEDLSIFPGITQYNHTIQAFYFPSDQLDRLNNP